MKSQIRVALIGIGNCASAVVQGVEYYKRAAHMERPDSGLMQREIGGYVVPDITFVAAFDVAEDKINRDLADALNSSLICTRSVADVPKQHAFVHPGVLLDGIGERAAEAVRVDDRVRATDGQAVRIVQALRSSGAEILVNFLPVGARRATEFYAQCAIEARCAFINAIPVPIGREDRWRASFADVGLPLLGDDVKSQVGATIVHRALVELFSSRGYDLDLTYQLNVGGNMDFLNMTNHERLADKKVSKAQAILDVANRGAGMAEGSYHISPSDYVPFLGDQKIAFIRLEGRGFAGAPIDIELRMSVADSPNSAGVIVDAVRYAKLALDRREGGYLAAPSAWLMKAPAFSLLDSEAKSATEAWAAEVEMTANTL